MASTYLGTFGDKLDTDGVEIAFSSPGDTGRHDAPCWYTLFRLTTHGIADRRKWRESGSQAPGQCCRVLPSFVSVIKLLRNLLLLIQSTFRVNNLV
jgi:hypothetical protein